MQVFETYKYPILGGVVGLVLALLLVTIGIFKTIILLLFVAVGAGVGWYVQETGLIESFLNENRK